MNSTSFSRLTAPSAVTRVGDLGSRGQRPRPQFRPTRPLIRASFQPLRSAGPYRLFDPYLLDRLHEPLTRFGE